MTFTFSDGWLLTTLWAIDRPCDRKKLNRMGDAFNHALFSDDEVAEGMRRLEAIGFAFYTAAGLFAVSNAGKAFVNSLWVPSDGHVSNMLKVTEALKARPL